MAAHACFMFYTMSYMISMLVLRFPRACTIRLVQDSMVSVLKMWDDVEVTKNIWITDDAWHTALLMPAACYITCPTWVRMLVMRDQEQAVSAWCNL